MKQTRLEALKLACFQGLEGPEAIDAADHYADFIENGKKVLQLEPKSVTKKDAPKRKILKLQE
jgi:hypothetical protein